MRKLVWILLVFVSASSMADQNPPGLQRSTRLTVREQRLLDMKNTLVNAARNSARSMGSIRQALHDEIADLRSSRTSFNLGFIDQDMQSRRLRGDRAANDRVELTFKFSCANVSQSQRAQCIPLDCRALMNVSQFMAQRTTDTLAIFQVACTNSRIAELANVNVVVDIVDEED